MRYYAHFGHTEFVLCLGYGAHHVKDYFLNYDETRVQRLRAAHGGRRSNCSPPTSRTGRSRSSHTGLDSPIGERLRRVRQHVENEEMFLANYADVLTDAPLDRMRRSSGPAARSAACWRSRPRRPSTGGGRRGRAVPGIKPVAALQVAGERRLLLPPPGDLRLPARGRRPGRRRLHRAGRRGQAARLPAHGFWHPADTVKERSELEALARQAPPPVDGLGRGRSTARRRRRSRGRG